MKGHPFYTLEIYIMISLAHDSEEFNSYMPNLMSLWGKNVSLCGLGKSVQC